MEAFLIILGDLAVVGSIALLLWGMALCAMVGSGQGSRELPAGERLPADPLGASARERIDDAQPPELREVAVRRPELAYAVLEADHRDPRIVGL